MNYVRASEHDQILLSFSKLNYLQPYHFKIDANPLCAQKNIYFTTKNDYYMTYPYSNIHRSHYDSTAEQQSKEITAHKIYFTAIFEYITQQALRCLGFYQVGKGAS